MRKRGRRVLWAAGILAAVLSTLYGFRWPLLHGTIRARLDRWAAEQGLELQAGGLSGSILFSITADDVRLRAGAPSSPLRNASAARVRASYGFLGLSRPRLRVESARLELGASPGPPAAWHETLSRAGGTLRSLPLPADVEIAALTVRLADGRTVHVDQASLDRRRAFFSGRIDPFGRVEIEARFDVSGDFLAWARAPEGPARSVQLRWAGDRLEAEAEALDRRWTWEGRAEFRGDRLLQLDGRLATREGTALTRLDLSAGTAEIEGDALLELKAPDLRARLDFVLRAAESAPGTWSLGECTVKAREIQVRTVPAGELDARIGPGTPGAFPFRIHATGPLRAEASGHFRWTGRAEGEVAGWIHADDLRDLLRIVDRPLPFELFQARLEASATFRGPDVRAEGRLEGGPGSWGGLTWEALTLRGSAGPGRADVGELALLESPYGARLVASGRIEARRAEGRVAVGRDRAEGSVLLGEGGDFDATAFLEGPLDWLQGFGLSLPEDFAPVRAAGSLRRRSKIAEADVRLTTGNGIAIAPRGTVRFSDEGWSAELAAGSVVLPAPRRLDYSAFRVAGSTGNAAVEGLALRGVHPSASARVAASARWDERRIEGTLKLEDATLEGESPGPLDASFLFDRPSGDLHPRLSWGKPEGERLELEGILGRKADVRALLRVPDLRTSALRRLLAAPPLDGGVAFDLHVTGTRDRPEVSGTLALDEVSAAGLPPLTLALPLTTVDGAVHVKAEESTSSYGRLSLEGRFPLPGSPAEVRADLRTEIRDLSPFLEKLSESARRWIPTGHLRAHAGLRGPWSALAGAVEADFESARFDPPEVVGPVEHLRVRARLDKAGLEVIEARGLSGKGPFRASGRWGLFEPDRPMTARLEGTDLLIVDLELFRLRVSPNVVFTRSDRRGARLSGPVDVPLAVCYHDFGSPSLDRSKAPRDVAVPGIFLVPAEAGGFYIPGLDFLKNVELDLTFKTTGEARIENSVVGVILEAEGRLQGSGSDPILSGRVRSVPGRGEVKAAPGLFLRIESAEIVLPDEPAEIPRIQAGGRVGTGESAITVHVFGPLQEPNLLLRSDPPRPQRELLARLAFGQEPGALTGGAAGAALALKVYSAVQEERPSPEPREGFFERIRPTIVSGSGRPTRQALGELPPTGTSRGTSLRTEYVYNEYFSIIAETSPQADVSGDIRLRIRF